MSLCTSPVDLVVDRSRVSPKGRGSIERLRVSRLGGFQRHPHDPLRTLCSSTSLSKRLVLLSPCLYSYSLRSTCLVISPFFTLFRLRFCLLVIIRTPLLTSSKLHSVTRLRLFSDEPRTLRSLRGSQLELSSSSNSGRFLPQDPRGDHLLHVP